jgi:SAM-dependent methyltransferase
MARKDQEHWDERYRSGTGPTGGHACQRLEEQSHLLKTVSMDARTGSKHALALDVACGTGNSMIWLALRRWRVIGVDISGVALSRADRQIRRAGVSDHCHLVLADLDIWRPPPDVFDLAICFYFFDRSLLPALRDAIRPGGVLICESFNQYRTSYRQPTNQSHLLRAGELLYTVRSWRWSVIAHDTAGPDSAYPTDSLVARKPG